MGWARGGSGRDHGRDDDPQYSAYDSAYGSAYDSAYGSAYGSAYDSVEERALVARNDGGLVTRPLSDEDLLIVPGDGIPKGNPFIRRRERPLTMRLTALSLMVAILITGIFAITPMGSNASSQISAFQAIAGSMVLQKSASYFLYTARTGDDVETVAKHFGVQIGGIYELNGLLAGQELVIGTAYKIPTDPNYGKDYRPLTYVVTTTSGGGNVFGSNWWNSVSGTPDPESPCAPDGHGNPLSYKLHSPNWGSYWVRGFSWFHNGDDLATKAGNPIHAAQSGQVIWAGYDATNGLGWSVKINNCNNISTVYGHMQKLLVKAGDFVLMGDPIGLEGSTGWSTGPHLHFMVEWYNNPVDPYPYFASTYNMTHYVA